MEIFLDNYVNIESIILCFLSTFAFIIDHCKNMNQEPELETVAAFDRQISENF